MAADGDAGPPASAGQQAYPRVIFYQVEYADGTSRNLPAVPRTADGIRRVERVITQAGKGAVVYSTTAPGVADVGGGRTSRTTLHWNGAAWVSPADIRRAAQPPLSNPSGSPATAPASRRATTQATAPAILVSAPFSRPADTAPAASQPSPPSLAQGAYGVVRPIDDVAPATHRAAVWKLPLARGQRAYRVAMAHAEAGEFGAFRYVAWADSDGDGLPDKLIARSPLMAARQSGDWSAWSFRTAEGDVFVGNEPADDETAIYIRPAGEAETNFRGLPTEMYVEGYLGGGRDDQPGRPSRRFQPYLTNIRVQLLPPDAHLY
jgi:hypothetical protein